jgi:hypothetical protein
VLVIVAVCLFCQHPVHDAECGGGLCRPAGSVAATRHEDMLAIDIYRRAEESGEEITLRVVERPLSELLAFAILALRARTKR